MRTLSTRKGILQFPLYIPVTTDGSKFPLDKKIRPYLPRVAPAVLFSYRYATDLKLDLNAPNMPIWIDSGGYLDVDFKILEDNGTAALQVYDADKDENIVISARSVLERQEEVADVGFTLDVFIPPGLDESEGRCRFNYTIENAKWALNNRRRRDLPLYAVIQWADVNDAVKAAQIYKDLKFEGAALGGFVPRIKSGIEPLIHIVEEVRRVLGDQIPLHILGIGSPELVRKFYEAGADSVDSASYIRAAADGKLWSDRKYTIDEPAWDQRMSLAIANLAYANQVAMPLPFHTQLSTFSLKHASP